MRIFLAVAALALCGCASSIMKGFVGKPIETPIAQYGPYTNTFDLPDGRRAFQWNLKSSGAIPITTNSRSTVSLNSNGFGTSYGAGGVRSASTTTSTLGTITTPRTTVVPYNKSCFYTLYASRSISGNWVVSGFEEPPVNCQ